MKKAKVLLLIICTMMIFTCFAMSVTHAETVELKYPMGDANLDGTVNAKDVVLIKQSIVGMTKLTEEQKIYADVYFDKVIDTRDAVLILQYIVGMDAEFIPHAHDYTAEIASEEYKASEATCDRGELYYYSCVCGMHGEETFEYGDELGHDYQTTVVDPTCEEQGYTVYTCHCGDTYTDDYVDELGHDYGAWVSNGNDTHTKVCGNDSSHTVTENCYGGTATCEDKAVCSDCGSEWGEPQGHDYQTTVVDPTCEEQGYTVYTCHCGDTYTDDYVDELGHDYGEWVSNGNDTHTKVCGNDASHTVTENCYGGTATCEDKAVCSDCGSAWGEPEGHDYQTTVVDPTCEEQGYTIYTCHCGDTYTDDYVDELGHDYGAWVSNGNDTHTKVCGNDSSHTVTENCYGGTATCEDKAVCSDCGSEWGEPEGHDYQTTVVDPTCEEQGYTVYTCHCGDTYTDDYVDELGHSYTYYVSDGNATYEADGTKTAQCDNGCGATDTIVDVGSMLIKDEIIFNTLTVEGMDVFGKVSNDTEEFDFNEEISFSGNSRYVVSLDKYGMQTIDSKILALEEGDNEVYVLETINGELVNTYNVIIRRRSIYTVSFETNGGTPIQSQDIEEDSLATRPADPEKQGYDFDDWGYDFNDPITGDIAINALWTPRNDTGYTVEYYQEKFEERTVVSFAEGTTGGFFGTSDRQSLANGESLTMEFAIKESNIPLNNWNMFFVPTQSDIVGVNTDWIYRGFDTIYGNWAYHETQNYVSVTDGSKWGANATISGALNPSAILAEGKVLRVVYTYREGNLSSLIFYQKDIEGVDYTEVFALENIDDEEMLIYDFNFVFGVNGSPNHINPQDDHFYMEITDYSIYKTVGNETAYVDGMTYCLNGMQFEERMVSFYEKMDSETENEVGTTEDYVEATIKDLYPLSYNEEKSSASGYILADGSLVLKVYYDCLHDFTQEIASEEYKASEATCTEKARYYYSCVCGMHGEETFEYGDELGHDYQTTVVDPTCEEQGYTVYSCHCGDIYTDDYVDELGHDYGAWVSNGNDTHTKVCGNDASHTVTENCYGGTATCEDKAVCSDCGSEWGEPQGHDYGEWAENEDGVYQRVCSRDSAHINTCGDDTNKHRIGGYTAQNDANYPFEVDGNVIRSTNHDDGSRSTYVVTIKGTSSFTFRYKVSSEGSCDRLTVYHNDTKIVEVSGERGWQTYTQSVQSGDVLTFIYSKDGSVSNGSDCAWVEFISVEGIYFDEDMDIEPLCDEDIVCLECGAVLVPQKGHDFTQEIVTNSYLASSATCTEKARYYYSCLCGDHGEETFEYGQVNSSAHDIEDTVVDPTKLNEGYTYHECSRCGYNYKDNYVSCTGSVGLGYNINSNGTTCTVTDIGTCSDTEVGIPHTIDGYTVTAIADKAFENQSQITVLTIPSTVTSIGTRAFYGCTGLNEITIPQSVTSIGTQIFYKSGVETVYYNSTYGSKETPFLNVTNIKKVVFGGRYVPDYALYQNQSVKEVEITSSVTSIGSRAFQNCSSLTSIVIPDSVTSLGSCAFYNCTSLETIAIPDSVTSIGSYAFYGCTSLLSVDIGDSVTSIGYNAFQNCSSLTSIEIPDSVTSIGDVAFYDCDSLTSIVIPDSVTSIGNSAFCGCTSLTSIEIPDSVTSIGEGAFYNCTSLETIEIPDSITIISSSTFYYCISLVSVNIPDSVTSIGYEAFRYCSSLTSIVIPDSVTSIEDYAFYRCVSLASVEIADSVTSIGDYAFWDCTSLETIEIPDSVTSIGIYAFSYCDSLTSIVIPDSVTSIGHRAFYDCYSLTIYCEATSKPSGWSDAWNTSDRPVVWGYNG